jgi:hypothetical protein
MTDGERGYPLTRASEPRTMSGLLGDAWLREVLRFQHTSCGVGIHCRGSIRTAMAALKKHFRPRFVVLRLRGFFLMLGIMPALKMR